MKQHLLLFGFLAYFILQIPNNNLFGQNIQQDIDSLESILSTHQLEEEAKGKLLKQIAIKYRRLGNYQKAIDYRLQVLETKFAQNSEEEKFLQYEALCSEYSLVGEFDKALGYCQKGLEVAGSQGSNVNKIKIYVGLGDHYRLNGNFAEALNYLLQAEKLNEIENDRKLAASIYSVLPAVYLSLGQMDNALPVMEKRIKILEEDNDKNQLGGAYVNLASIHAHMGQETLAKEEVNKGLIILRELGREGALMRALYLLASIEMNLGQFEKSENSFKESLVLSEKLDDAPIQFENHMGIANVLFLQKKYNNSIYYCEKAKDLLKASGVSYELEYLYGILHKNYKALGQFEAALSAHEEWASHKDSLLNESKVQAITEMETKYESEKKQRENEFLAKENDLLENRNNLFLFLIGGLAVALLIFGILYYLLQKTRNQLAALNRTKDKLFSIIAHDLRGPMVYFRGIAQKMAFLMERKEFARAQSLGQEMDKAALNMNALLDNLLNWSRVQTERLPYHPESIPLHALVGDLVQQHQPLAEAKGIQLTFENGTPTDAWADPDAVSTIIRNLVNNAIKFTLEGGKVRVAVHTNGEMTKVSVQDDGIGISTEKQQKLFQNTTLKSQQGTKGEKGTGLGLHLCQDLVKLNKGEIKVESIPGEGSIFEVHLPKPSDQS